MVGRRITFNPFGVAVLFIIYFREFHSRLMILKSFGLFASQNIIEDFYH